MMGFILSGQTDSGKSTVAGHLLHLVGYFQNQLDEADLPVYRKHLASLEQSQSKSKYSWLMDALDGEVLAEKTKTQHFALIPFVHEQSHFTLIDTPGHFTLIRNLIEGLFQLSQTPIFVLVLSSIPHEFEEAWARGTSKENLLLGRAAGCTGAIIAWNKCDVKRRLPEHQQQVDQFAKPLRFKRLQHLDISGYQGHHLLTLLASIKEMHSTIPVAPLPEAKEETSPQWIASVSFLVEHHPGLLVTRGFSCVAHHRSGEYTVEVMKMPRSVGRIKESAPVKVVLLFTPGLTARSTDRLIFRTPEATIGFGVIHQSHGSRD